MSEVPTEYKMFKKKFFKSMKPVYEDLVVIIVYGGASTNRIFSGTSDIDFFILLKRISDLSRPLSEIIADINSILSEYASNPLFAAILDYDIYTYDMIPTDQDLHGFSPIRACALATGECLYGENPFTGFEVSGEDLKNGARRMIQDYFEKLHKSGIVLGYADEELSDTMKMELEMDKEFNAIDAILSSYQALLRVKTGSYVTMPDVVLKAETEPEDGVNVDLVRIASLMRQGIETDSPNIYAEAYEFLSSIIIKIS